MIVWKHDDLLADLVTHLRGYSQPAMIWADMQLGPSGSPRPDVYSLHPTYQRISATVFEIKISRADFLHDVQAGKSLKYRKYAGAVSYATPKGMVKKTEVPDGIGLIERGDETWRWVRKPMIQALDHLPQETWMKLLIDGVHREQSSLRQPRVRTSSEWSTQQKLRDKLGKELSQLLNDRSTARARLELEIAALKSEKDEISKSRSERMERAVEIQQQAIESLRAEYRRLCREIGIDENTSSYQLRSEIDSLRPANDRKELHDVANDLERRGREMQERAAEIRQRLPELRIVA